MIGTMNVAIEILPRTGDRVDARASVEGPSDTMHIFPLSTTGTIQAVYKLTMSLSRTLTHQQNGKK